jgi:hypothetical protein
LIGASRRKPQASVREAPTQSKNAHGARRT